MSRASCATAGAALARGLGVLREQPELAEPGAPADLVESALCRDGPEVVRGSVLSVAVPDTADWLAFALLLAAVAAHSTTAVDVSYIFGSR